MTTKLVYNGSVTTTFVAIGAELNPGDEFYVSEELAGSFLQRPDVELAADHGMVEPEAETAPKPAKKSAQPEPVAEAPETK